MLACRELTPKSAFVLWCRDQEWGEDAGGSAFESRHWQLVAEQRQVTGTSSPPGDMRLLRAELHDARVVLLISCSHRAKP